MLLKANHLYINTPFCQSLCQFCNFYKNPIHYINQFFKEKTLSEYYLEEMNLKRDHIASSQQSIYVGGGSPLEIPPSQLLALLEHLQQYNASEFTLESNPHFTTNTQYYKYFNRISIGVQSFHPPHLLALGRDYKVEEGFLKTIASLISNVSYDLIYDIPNQTTEELQQDLQTLISHHPKHISYYLLEDNPITKKKRTSSENSLLSDYQLIQKTLSDNGYETYELSNHSQPGYASIHNQAYWEEKDYVGIGPGASGRYSDEQQNVYRYQNHRNLKKYKEAIDNKEMPYEQHQKLSLTEVSNEYLMTHIRRPKGIDLQVFQARFNKKLLDDRRETINKYKKFLNITDTHIQLKMEGYMYIDEITSELFF